MAKGGSRDGGGGKWWFDGHLDLATLAVEGRDMTVELSRAVGRPQPAGVTLPSLAEGGVRAACATIFTALDYEGPCGYPRGGSVQGAFEAGRRQARVYEEWEEAGLIRMVRGAGELNGLGSDGFAEAETSHMPLQVILLMEGADPIRSPEDVEWWWMVGLRVVGLTWAIGTRYAGGNHVPGPLTSAGREVIAAMDEVGMIHDFSHLADEAAEGVLECARGPVMASHSNCRALVDGMNQRHLTDDLIREIGKRGGVVGVNLYSKFLVPPATDGVAERRATIAETVEHIERIAEMMGRRDGLGLGSDMDGGFGADRMPEGINEPRDLEKLAVALTERGWSETEVEGFRWGNWMKFMKRNLG